MLSIEVLLKLKLLYKYNLLHLDFSSNYYYNIRSSILVGVQNPRSIKVYSFRKKKQKIRKINTYSS